MEAKENQQINNIESISSELNFSNSLNNKENQIKKNEKEKNEHLLSFSFQEILNSKENNNLINASNINNINYSNAKFNNLNFYFKNKNKLIKDKEIILPYIELSKISNEKEKEKETISSELIIDDIKLKVDYTKIESELNKLRNNYNENKIKEDINNNKNTIDSNKNKTDNKKIHGTSVFSNSQIEGDLFYYSEEEDDKYKQIKSNNELIKIIQENINKIEKSQNEYIIGQNENIKNNIIINNEEKNNQIEKKENSNNPNLNINLKKLLENAEYGIDETGNPISLQNYNEEVSNSNKSEKIKKLIAYIIQSEEKGKNYLINLNGETIPKMEDGDFNYKDNNMHIIIKNFDVQNPKLRVFGVRQRYSSIVSEEDNKKQNSKEEKIGNIQNKILLLFNQIKEEINNKNEKDTKINNYSPTAKRINYFEQNFKEKTKNNQYFDNWMKNVRPISENRSRYIYNRNTKNILYQKLPIKKIINKNLVNLSRNIERSNIVEKTSEILNKSENKKIIDNNNLYEKINNNHSLKNIFLKNKKIGNNTWRFNRTPSPVIKEYIYEPQKIKNQTSRVNIYKIKRLKNIGKLSCNDYSNIFKLNFENNQNQFLNNNEPEILKNSFSSFLSNSFLTKNNPLLNISDQMQKTDYSTFFRQNSKKKKESLLKKSSSFNSQQLASTLNSISNNIKNIENNIHNTLLKLINRHRVLNKDNNNLKKEEISISSYNSKFTTNNITSTNSFDKKKLLKNKLNSNFNNESKINLRKIPLNKKYKISKSPRNIYKCQVLSNEADKMIKDYSNKSIGKKKLTENPFKKLNNYNYMKNNENKNKIRAFISKNKSNNLSKNISNKSYNVEQIAQKKTSLNKKFDKNFIYIKSNQNNKLIVNNSFNKLCEKNNVNKKNNKKYRNKAIPIKTNLNNKNSKQKSSNLKKINSEIMNKVIRNKEKKEKNKTKFSSQSTSINSIKEISLNEK